MADVGTITKAAHTKYAEKLTEEQIMLIMNRDDSMLGYAKPEDVAKDGKVDTNARWDRMLADLKVRLGARPYIFKLVNRIKQDIPRVETLQAYETTKGINLVDYLSKPEE